jgi:GNAT superfamily N-acetyltransferase
LDSATEVRLSRRPLTEIEAVRLHEELKTTPHILGYTVRELRKFPRVWVAEAGEGSVGESVLAGACISKDLLLGWTDIAMLYVLPEFRGRGIGARLYESALDDARERGRHIYTLSRSPEMIHLMKRFGLTITKSWSAPLAVHLEMQRHMMSVYRWREAARKEKMRRGDGNAFVAGIRRYRLR